MTYYLKYRPKTISELDLVDVRQALSEAFAQPESPHAWLFAGPRGTGKTSAARIIAKLVNCAKPEKSEPCGQCDSCQAIESGRTLDILEIDAASNRGIDDIRDLREKIKLSPAKLKYKVYIIDEVHMLTTEAFNALLKTLEEPPQHAKFILCTTEFNKLPQTIVSRCNLVKFRRAKTEELIRSLKRVIKGEKLTISEKDLSVVAKSSDASFRDAVKILESLAQTGQKISSQRVAEMLQRGLGGRNLNDWLNLVYSGQASEALDWFNKALNEGLNVRQFMIEAIDRLRLILLKRLGVAVELDEESDLPKISDTHKLKDLLNRLLQAERELNGISVASLPLELMMAELDQPEAAPAAPKPALSKTAPVSLKIIEDNWEKVLVAIRPHNHSLEALLKACRPHEFDGQRLKIKVFYKFHKDRLEEDKYRRLIELSFSEILGRPIVIKFFLGNKSDKSEPEDMLKTAQAIFKKEVK